MRKHLQGGACVFLVQVDPFVPVLRQQLAAGELRSRAHRRLVLALALRKLHGREWDSTRLCRAQGDPRVAEASNRKRALVVIWPPWSRG